MKTITYFFRGQIERGTGQPGYAWYDGFSADADDGGTLYPWQTRREAQAEARSQGAQAIFQRHHARCYDNGGETADRYTVVYLDCKNERNGFFECIGCNGSPFHPQGIGQHSECQDGPHLGQEIEFERLPSDVQTLALRDLREIENVKRTQ